MTQYYCFVKYPDSLEYEPFDEPQTSFNTRAEAENSIREFTKIIDTAGWHFGIKGVTK